MEETESELLKKADLNMMLEFETQIFLDAIHNDGLVITAKGLNVNLVILNLLKVYCDPGNLVLVINASEQEEKYYKEKLNDRNVYSITASSNSVAEREDVYLSGGINFVSTRILVVDMLKKRLPIEKITGLVVLRAHTIFESCQEAFVLRLYRQGNKTGFIKAFSNSAQSFTVGFGHVERVMRALFLKDLYIWPRFHTVVIKSLKERQPSVIELHIPISEKMKKMQTHILELMNLTVKELKEINKGIEIPEITVENCLTKKFHKILQAQLDVIWHQLSRRSLQLVEDLKTLRHMILTMFYSDPVTFYATVMKYRTKEYAQIANWVLRKPAELIFTHVSSFIFNKEKEIDPDFCPKWNSLLELLKVEVPAQIKKMKKRKDNTVLILCSDYRTCHQLNEVLTNGPHYFLFLNILKNKIPFKTISKNFSGHKIPEEVKTSSPGKNKKLKSNDTTATSSETNNEEESEVEEAEKFQSSYILTMSQVVSNDDNEKETDVTFEPFSQMENMNLTQIIESIEEPKIIIQPFNATGDFLNLQHALEILKPTFIIMYHCSMTAVREIEMYETHRSCNTPVNVYFLIHAGTVEEQCYLTTLKREKECFEFLIETKSTMVIPEDQDGKSDSCATLERESQNPVKSTRDGKRNESTKRPIVIVDMREFRSDLPALIHKRGMDIEPITITVGDYILTPEICVERKSLSDLIGSLNSGRLYQQCTQMSRFYSKPMLLIEFDQNKCFGWQNSRMLPEDSQQKLLLLTLHFPKLRIIWSPSAYASAQLFEELKTGKDDPNIEYAAAIGEQDLDVIETKYNSAVYDFVQKLPGITSKNIDMFLRKVKSLDNALTLSEDELKDIFQNTNEAQAFYSALHGEHSPKNETEQNQKEQAKSRRFFKRNNCN